MEEIAEGTLKVVLRLLSLVVRALIWLVVDLWFEAIAWYLGWPICRLLSLGRYPHESVGEYDRASTLTNMIVGLVGLASLFGLAVLLAKSLGALQ